MIPLVMADYKDALSSNTALVELRMNKNNIATLPQSLEVTIYTTFTNDF